MHYIQKLLFILILIVDFHHYLHLCRYSSPHQNSNPLRTSCLYPYGCTYYNTFDSWELTHHCHRNVLLWLVLQFINGIHRKKFPTSVTKGLQNVYLILLSLPFEQNSSRDCISVAPLVLYGPVHHWFEGHFNVCWKYPSRSQAIPFSLSLPFLCSQWHFDVS